MYTNSAMPVLYAYFDKNFVTEFNKRMNINCGHDKLNVVYI